MRKLPIVPHQLTLRTWSATSFPLSSVFKACAIAFILLQYFWLIHIFPTECPFLQGRAFVFASQFSDILQPEIALQYLNAAIQVLEAPDASIPIRVSAVRSVQT